MARIKNEYTFEYIVNDDKTAVSCVATVRRLDRKFYQLDKLACTAKEIATGKQEKHSRVPIKLKYVGVARLKDGDESDIEFAKKVARAKALRTANAEMANCVRQVLETLDKSRNAMANLMTETGRKSTDYAVEVFEMTGHDASSLIW